MTSNFSKTLLLATLSATFTLADRRVPDDNFAIEGDESTATINMRYVPETDEVEFIVSLRNSYSWVGMALGAQDMTPYTDMLVFYSGTSFSPPMYEDRVSAGFREPNIDRFNNLADHPDGGYYEHSDEDRVTFFVRRALDTDDLEDFVIPLDEEFDIGYSLNDLDGQMSPYTYH